MLTGPVEQFKSAPSNPTTEVVDAVSPRQNPRNKMKRRWPMEIDYTELKEVVLHIHTILINLCIRSEGIFCAMLGLANFCSIPLNTEFKHQL